MPAFVWNTAAADFLTGQEHARRHWGGSHRGPCGQHHAPRPRRPTARPSEVYVTGEYTPRLAGYDPGPARGAWRSRRRLAGIRCSSTSRTHSGRRSDSWPGSAARTTSISDSTSPVVLSRPPGRRAFSLGRSHDATSRISDDRPGAGGRVGDDDNPNGPPTTGPIIFTAQLSPANEVPPITGAESSGRGFAIITFNVPRDNSGAVNGAGTATFEIQTLGSPTARKPSLAHIHPGAAGVKWRCAGQHQSCAGRPDQHGPQHRNSHVDGPHFPGTPPTSSRTLGVTTSTCTRESMVAA